MEYKMMPAFWVEDLKEALTIQYGREFMDEVGDLRNFLFDTNYMNDVYVEYGFDEIEEYTGEEWQDENHIRLENCIKTFLKDIFPNHDSVLIDVMW